MPISASLQFDKRHEMDAYRGGEGDPDAQGVLAVFLHEGLGTVKDFPQAFSWAQKSATQNNIVGETILAELYQKGEGHGGRCKEG